MKSILSTRNLKPYQRDLLLGQGFSLVDYDAIEIQFIDFKMPSEIENGIFTSQNGVNAILKTDYSINNCFCVGQKTKALLEGNSLKVIETANYGADLAQIIANKYKERTFYFFCGEQRRDEIPDTLKTSNIEFIEVNTYKTILKPRRYEQKWDGILFYSPSGVESYFTLNKTVDSTTTLFCIGETTANAAKKHSDNIVVSTTTSVESVIKKAVETLK
ncbi:uroporphyrinogen-III synthase [Patiriisocius marinus]|uniref:Uroporphyrinogen III methyltransferase n=1 Tax=Patiriisocius marinus TaxID=1397112 RepID=A0A5J4IZ40_9FLAO|nr:uroporphyrinogen-III synthase [Patiriisocius marinus]GER58753.1 uroporphyrinogen III methyltransferase [Patiriisocius marinus]